MAQGGTFIQGAAAALASKAGSYIGRNIPNIHGRAMVSGMMGMVSAAATGGDVEQIAMQAIMVHLLNYESSEYQEDTVGELRMEISRGVDGTDGVLRLYEGEEAIFEGSVYNRDQSSDGDPFGSMHQIADGDYTVIRRLTSLSNRGKYPDGPAITNTGIPGRIDGPFGTVRTGILFHHGTSKNWSRGCFVVPNFTYGLKPLLESYQQYFDKGIPLKIYTTDG